VVEVEPSRTIPPILVLRSQRLASRSCLHARILSSRTVLDHSAPNFLTERSLLLIISLSQVIKCLYPAVPDYLPGVGQTGALALISFLAAYVVNDQSVSFGQSTYHTDAVHETAAKRFVVHCAGRSGDNGTAAALGDTSAEYGLKIEVPLALQDIVEKVIWVRARPAARGGSEGGNRGSEAGRAAELVLAKN